MSSYLRRSHGHNHGEDEECGLPHFGKKINSSLMLLLDRYVWEWYCGENLITREINCNLAMGGRVIPPWIN